MISKIAASLEAEQIGNQYTEVTVKLLPPLSSTTRRDWVKMSLSDATVGGVIDALIEKFDTSEFRLHLYDTEGRLVPAWCALINGRPVRLNRREALETAVENGDEITFLLNLAGG